MKMKHVIQRAAAALLSFLLCAVCLPQAYALDPIEDRFCSLTLNFAYPDVTFQLYCVGGLSQEGRFTPAGDFADYPVSFSGLDSALWRAMAETLAGYADRDRLTPLTQGTTDSRGNLTFQQLRSGLYLGVGERTAVSEIGPDGREVTTYITPEPFLVSLPHWQQEGGWLYDVTVTPKFELSRVESVMRRVLKVWNDAGHENQRPARITVDLLRDGVVFDTVTLNAETNWRYVWEDLDNHYQWRVVERDGASGYQVSVSLRGVTFVITNSYPGTPPPDDPPPETPPDEPGTPDTPRTPDEEIPDNPPPLEDMNEPDPPVDADEDVELDEPEVPLANLPQTGQLWWPVPLLAMSGMFLFLLGWIRRRNADEES